MLSTGQTFVVETQNLFRHFKIAVSQLVQKIGEMLEINWCVVLNASYLFNWLLYFFHYRKTVCSSLGYSKEVTFVF